MVAFRGSAAGIPSLQPLTDLSQSDGVAVQAPSMVSLMNEAKTGVYDMVNVHFTVCRIRYRHAKTLSIHSTPDEHGKSNGLFSP